MLGIFDLFKKSSTPPNSIVGTDSNIAPTELVISNSGIQTNDPNYRASGVTFNNDNGESRQSIISKIKPGEKLSLKIVTYEGKDAIAIFSEKNKQVGFVKSGNVNKTLKHVRAGGFAVVTKAQKSETSGNYYLVYKLKN